MQSELRAAHGAAGVGHIAPFLAVLAMAGAVLPASWAKAQDRFTTSWYPQRGGGERFAADPGETVLQGPVVQGTMGQGPMVQGPVVQEQAGGAAEGDMGMEPAYEGPAVRGSCDSCGDGMGPCGYGQGWSRGGGGTFLFGPDGTLLPNGFYFRGEYLMWWDKAGSAPPLVTTSPAGTAQAQAGVLGQTGTTVLFGDGLSFGTASGARFTLGRVADPVRAVRAGGDVLLPGAQVGQLRPDQRRGPDPRPAVLQRPTAAQDAVLIAYPNFASGTVSVSASTELQSLDLVLRRAIAQYPNMRFDLLAGYRYAQLREDLTVNTSLTSPLAPGTVLQTLDAFGTRNEFNGAEFGVSAQSRSYGWTLELLAKMALGGTHSVVTTSGTDDRDRRFLDGRRFPGPAHEHRPL